MKVVCMRCVDLLVALGAVCLMSGCPAARAADSVAWDPQHWLTLARATTSAEDRGDLQQAERSCAAAVAYAESHVVAALYRYAEQLQELRSSSAATARENAARLKQRMQERGRSGKPNSAYLGFVPSEELMKYAQLLRNLGRGTDAEGMNVLAVADRHSQGTHVLRGVLLGRGMPIRGACCRPDLTGCPALP
jgi:hypothetical protein